MSVIKLLETGQPAPGYQRLRVWATSGDAMELAPRLYVGMTAWREVGMDECEPAAIVQAPKVGRLFYRLPPGLWLDLTAWAGLMMIPRAMELTPRGVPYRYFVEFVALDEGIRFSRAGFKPVS